MYTCSCAHWIVGTVLGMHIKLTGHTAQLMRPAAGINQNTYFAVGDF